MLVGTNNGLFSSIDGGDSWTQTAFGTIYDIEFKPNDPTTVYYCNGTVWKSTDGGDNFLPSTSGLPFSSSTNRALIAVTADNPDYIYYVAGDDSDDSFHGLYRSEDAGTTWSLQADSPNIFSYAEDGSGTGGQSWYDMALTASPTNAEEIYIGGINVWKSNDGGTTFNITSHWVHPSSIGYTHADIHVLETFGDKIYCGSDGGVFVSNDTANTWVDITFGLQISQFYGFGSSENNPFLIIAGAQDNGTNLWSNASWAHVIGADGMEALIDWSNPATMYGSIQNGSLRKSTDGGASFFGISSDMTDVETGNWVTPFDIDPSNNSILYAGYENLWKTTNGGNSWFTISDFTTSSIDQIAIAPNSSNFIYVSVNSLLQMTFNGGTSWSSISVDLPNYTITDIAVDPEFASRCWITYSNYTDSVKVFRTDDAGANWTNISGSLPNLPVNCVATERGDYNGVYVGMDVGVYYTNDTIADWLPYFDDLPNVIVNELEVNHTLGRVRAATFGRGMWESNMYTKPLIVEQEPPNSITKASSELHKFSVFPNPTNGKFIINGTEELMGETIFIYDRTGKLIKTKSFSNESQEIDLSEFPTGIYLIKIGEVRTSIIKH